MKKPKIEFVGIFTFHKKPIIVESDGDMDNIYFMYEQLCAEELVKRHKKENKMNYESCIYYIDGKCKIDKKNKFRPFPFA